MSDSTALLMTAIIVVVIFLVIYLIDRRSRKDRGMFTRPPSMTMRIFAGLLGLVFGAIFIYELTLSNTIHLIWPVVAFALLAYSLGASNLLLKLQGGQVRTNPPAVEIVTPGSEPLLPKRLLRLLFILIVGVAGIVAVFYGSLWILGHPEAGAPFVIVLAIGFVALVPLRYLSFFFELYRANRKKGADKQ
jgi:hypothetical protein